MISTWHSLYLTQLNCLSFAQLETLFVLSEFQNWPNAEGLNELKTRYKTIPHTMPEFVCQSSLSENSDYYEQIIYQQGHIPTRADSWHDLFNGLIWLQFPQVKQLLNQLHMDDIKQHGLNPRTPRRNNLTHFDECGVILVVEEGHEFLLEQLTQHQWQRVFVEHRDLWGQQIQHFMFGHANLEMLLKPFIGLTGKWLGLKVPKGFASLPLKQQLDLVDEQLAGQIRRDNLFAHKKALLPIPLLGIPGCYADNQHADFYHNTDYFRPKSR
jgi:hypothetical protein